MEHFDILGIGVVAVDDLLYVDAYPAAEQKVRVRQRRRQPGGLTGTALVAAARLGCQAAYAGVLGDDELSQYVIDALRREGIEMSHRVRQPDARPAHSTIIVDLGQKTRTIFASLEGEVGADPELPDAELIRSARVLLVDHHGVEGTIRAVRIARESGVGVVADFERDPGGRFAELLPLVDHLIVSERFARELTGAGDAVSAAQALWQPGRQAVVVTAGAAGCWHVGPAGTNDEARHVPAFAIDVVDTTGCGDVFHGAYAAALAWGRELPDRVLFASAAAALKATGHGGQEAIPSRRQVDEFLAARRAT